MKIAVKKSMKVEKLLEKLLFDEEKPLTIEYRNKKTQELDNLFVSKKDIMECIKNKYFELDDEIYYFDIEEVEDKDIRFTPTPYLVEIIKEETE